MAGPGGSPDAWRGRLRLAAGAAVAVLAFLVAVRLLGAATGVLAPEIEALLTDVAGSDASTLGLSWLAAYVLGNGSVVAAVAVSLFESALLSPAQLFLAVAGSRIGAAGIVVLVGAVDYVQRGRLSIGESVSLGMVAFVLTAVVYVPGIVAGYAALPLALSAVPVPPAAPDAAPVAPGLWNAAVARLVGLVGAPGALVLAVGLLFGALWLFDRLLSRVHTDWLRGQIARWLATPWRSFAVGFVLTAVATSVAFSIGVLVPLYNRRYVSREEVVPFVMAANLATLLDTLLVAVVLGSGRGTAVVAYVLAVGTAVTAAYLLRYRPFYAAVSAVADRLAEDPRALAAGMFLLAAVPLGLVLVG